MQVQELLMHQDKFAILPFLASVDMFWPSEWNSTVFLAVDSSAEDAQLCSELALRVQCLVPPTINRFRGLVDSIEFSGREVSRRYKDQLLG